ncbi:MerR family DNA-binding protein [Sinomonas terrae]|uniref:MerR family DNA-binding protein n=1 Tax=Sinomonas terrae TaxID=2908838 RepID=A0ABS9U3F4_9MICC|nr:MerR family DNA-binding protein [Sinomonas terrae]MCH6471224.1 MerR family DNA-binding protein [Sinomonas terrae]
MRISEAAAAAGTTAKTLRFYEDIGLLPGIGRTPSGYRDYPHEAVQRAAFIRRSRAAGLSLEQAGDLLAMHDAGTRPCSHVRDRLADQLEAVDARISELQALRKTLAAQHRAAGSGPEACDPRQVCSYL